MAESSRQITLTVPLFSSDYAKREKEIAEWNRRARAFSVTIEQEIRDEIARLVQEISNVSGDVPGIATATTFGTVKINTTVPNPVVYIKSAVDALISNLQSQITALQVSIAELVSWQTPQKGSGDPNGVVVGRFDGDEYWDTDLGPPGTYRWADAINGWWSM